MSFFSPATLAETYRRFGPALARKGRRILRDASEVDDVIQEAFCRFVERGEPMRDPQATYAYLQRSVVNLCLDRIAGGRSQPTDPASQLFAAVPAPDRTGEVEARARLSLLLAGLDEETRAIGVLVLLEGQTQEEAAQSLGLSRRTVGTKLQKFEAHVRKRAERFEGDAGPTGEEQP